MSMIMPRRHASAVPALLMLFVTVADGEQASKGSLEVGKVAAPVILDENPLKVDRMAIKDIKVMETIKEGKTIYKH